MNSTVDLAALEALSAPMRDMITMMCGERLGNGAFRVVHDYNMGPLDKYVIKIEPLNTGHNEREYLLWEQIKWLSGDLTWVKPWFAPVKYISPNGRILIQEKTKPIPESIDLEKLKVPEMIHDAGVRNFGYLKGHVCCHDYGSIYGFLEFPKKFKNLQK